MFAIVFILSMVRAAPIAVSMAVVRPGTDGAHPPGVPVALAQWGGLVRDRNEMEDGGEDLSCLARNSTTGRRGRKFRIAVASSRTRRSRFPVRHASSRPQRLAWCWHLKGVRRQAIHGSDLRLTKRFEAGSSKLFRQPENRFVAAEVFDETANRLSPLGRAKMGRHMVEQPQGGTRVPSTACKNDCTDHGSVRCL